MTGPSATPIVELVGATKRYGDQLALDDVSLSIEPGEFFCLLGPSGCGKTTTLNLIGGFIPLTAGELRIEGHRVNDLPPTSPQPLDWIPQVRRFLRTQTRAPGQGGLFKQPIQGNVRLIQGFDFGVVLTA